VGKKKPLSGKGVSLETCSSLVLPKCPRVECGQAIWVKEKTRRDKCTGSIYKRTWKNKGGETLEGKTWWIKYYKRGRAFQERTKFTDKTDAPKLLSQRLHEIDRDGKPGVHFDRFRFEDLVRLFVIDRRNERGIKTLRSSPQGPEIGGKIFIPRPDWPGNHE
jgi:hypothetical protein